MCPAAPLKTVSVTSAEEMATTSYGRCTDRPDFHGRRRRRGYASRRKNDAPTDNDKHDIVPHFCEDRSVVSPDPSRPEHRNTHVQVRFASHARPVGPLPILAKTFGRPCR